MSKKLLIVLAAIAAIMMVGASSASKGSKESSAKAQLSLFNMEGKPAPDFSLPDQRGQIIKLSSLHGKKVILFFNEGIMCYPACWNQMAALGTDEKLNNTSVASFSIVTDSPDQWSSAFKKMPELNKGNILFDSTKAVSNQYGMLAAESSMHRGSMPGHTFILLDQKGFVRFTLDDPKMGVQNTVLATKVSEI